MRKEIAGGMTEQEARSLLLKRGVRAFQTLAGSLPQKEPEIANFDDVPTFSVLWNTKHTNISYGNIKYHYKLWLRCDEPLCCDCGDALEIALQPASDGWRFVSITACYDDKSMCVCCGRVCRDDIPF